MLYHYMLQDISLHATAVDKWLLTPAILEAGRKFSFGIKKHENQLLGGIFCQLLAVSAEYLLFPVIYKLV